MKLLSSVRNWFGSSRPKRELAQAKVKDTPPTEQPTCKLSVWLLVNDRGEFVAGSNPLALNDEYKYLTGGGTDYSRPVQLVELTVTLPLPRPIEVAVRAGG
ncbi:hypothetical protein GobsT_71100 [Gemmata obscuriglobus]|uniref:Uncharacterized protein n=1 Tax=Gemmata obscuriglobus TaxID=114 RepID=A0A2Z3H6Y6_9BACT|nr:hypothetical protein [Gemmata obscuriglobus]AWM41783.1 hypothetical protein C1280_35500 [Gemmata obscuriglobus]QEG32257.1 hypothetical protein GobsT_71100 [Gemmata obscuriglobus]VTS11613.1 unnamed protein product [Gemmata obscuriglobus UQM 2246]